MRYVKPTRHGWLSTAELAYLSGVTYRRLDYIARQMRHVPGSGNPRMWPPGSLHRLMVASALAPHDAAGGPSPFPEIARAVFDAPPPPDAGWVTYAKGKVTYSATPALALYDLDRAVIARIPTNPDGVLLAQQAS